MIYLLKLWKNKNYSLKIEFLYKNLSFSLYKGSEWMSLFKNIIKKLINNINLFHKYKEDIKKKIIIRKSKESPDIFFKYNNKGFI